MSPSVDFSKYGDVIPREHIPALNRDLARVPDFSWLLTSPDAEGLQGDLIKQVPFCLIGADCKAHEMTATVLVLNNTCDLQPERSQMVTVSLVFDFNDFIESQRKTRAAQFKGKNFDASFDAYIKDVRSNNITEIIYLPQFNGYENGAVVLLNYTCSMATEVYDKMMTAGSALASFTQTGFYFFLMKLVNHLARQEAPDVSRELSVGVGVA